VYNEYHSGVNLGGGIMDVIWQFEIIVLHWIQNLGDWLVEPMRAITLLGSEQFFILILPVILWCFDYGLGLRVGMILMSSNLINHALKLTFHSPRPFWYSPEIQAHSVENTFGMPSGHSMNTISVFGLIAANLNRKWIKWTCAILIFGVGFSRLFLGMHFISDVLGGWLFAGALLFFFVRFGDRFVEWFLKRPIISQYALVGLSTLVWILIAQLAMIGSQEWQMPSEWITNAIRFGEDLRPDPFDVTGAYTGAGIWLGLGAGAVWLRQRGGFTAKSENLQPLFRYLIGLAGTVFFWIGLDQVFPDGTSLIPLVFRLIRYALVGFWVSGAAPEIFIKLKIAHR
jgi:membrane-associated phospholipid phosphatase